MDFHTVVTTAGTCRDFRPDAVPDDVLRRVLDAARFAPSGGNRQPVRLVVVRDAALRRQLRDLYVPLWETYVARMGAGGTGQRARLVARADRFARGLDAVPVLVVVCAMLGEVLPTDAHLGRLSVVGGASIYPAVQNLLLAARDAGLGAALTTLLCAVEPQVKALLAIPDEAATAALVALGWPAEPFPGKLTRRPLAAMAFGDRWGAPL
jgi:nitroreductase